MARLAVLIVDPNRLFREGLAKLLRTSKFTVLQSVGSLEELRLDFSSSSPDLIVFGLKPDLDVDEQFKQLGEMRAKSPHTRIILLTHSNDTTSLLRAATAGFDAALSRDISGIMLERSLELVMLGQQVFPALALVGFASGYCGQTSLAPAELDGRVDPAVIRLPVPPPSDQVPVPFMLAKVKHVTAPLSNREDQILQLLVAGAPNKLIARDLGITEGTVKVHVKSLCRKLGAINRTQAAVWAQRQ